MTQPEFIICQTWRKRGDPSRFVQVGTVSASHPEINREAKHQPFRGVFRMVEGTGKYRRDVFRIVGKDPASGDPPTATVPATAAGVKSAVRRLRPQEAERLDEIDAEIGAVRARLRALNGDRRAAVADAFAKGHVVRLNELPVTKRLTHADTYTAVAVFAAAIANRNSPEFCRNIEFCFRYPSVAAEVVRLFEDSLAPTPDLLAAYRAWRDELFRLLDACVSEAEGTTE